MRKCGECGLCCQVLWVPELDKQENEICRYYNNGCTIYDNRPDSCKYFECQWLKGEMAENLRPDKVHFCLESLVGVPVIFASLEPGHYYSIFKKTSELRFYTDHGYSVIATNGATLLADGHTLQKVWDYVKRAAKEMMG